MRLDRLSVVSILVIAACGGDDGAGGADAAPMIDAPIDASGLSGLGQPCVVAMNNADCPANAPRCVGFTNAGGTYCTPLCVTNGTATGAAMGQFSNIMPAPSNTVCSAAFTGTVGMPVCAAVLTGYMPADAAVVVGRSYTNINMSCAVTCGAAMACPPGLTANNNLGACLCVP